MKKIIAQMLAVLVLASFAAFVAGCKSGDDSSTTTPTKTDTKTGDTGTPDTGK